MEPSAKKSKLAEVTSEAVFKPPQIPQQDEELSLLWSRLSEDSLKALLFDSAHHHPELLKSWYKNADTEANMRKVINVEARKCEKEFEHATALDASVIDSLVASSEDLSSVLSRLETLKQERESRQGNERLDFAAKNCVAFLKRTIAQAQSLISRGLYSLGVYTMKAILERYSQSTLVKDSFIFETEESEIVARVIAVDSSLQNSVSVQSGTIDDMRSCISSLTKNLVYSTNATQLSHHVAQKPSTKN